MGHQASLGVEGWESGCALRGRVRVGARPEHGARERIHRHSGKSVLFQVAHERLGGGTEGLARERVDAESKAGEELEVVQDASDAARDQKPNQALPAVSSLEVTEELADRHDQGGETDGPKRLCEGKADCSGHLCTGGEPPVCSGHMRFRERSAADLGWIRTGCRV